MASPPDDPVLLPVYFPQTPDACPPTRLLPYHSSISPSGLLPHPFCSRPSRLLPHPFCSRLSFFPSAAPSLLLSSFPSAAPSPVLSSSNSLLLPPLMILSCYLSVTDHSVLLPLCCPTSKQSSHLSATPHRKLQSSYLSATPYRKPQSSSYLSAAPPLMILPTTTASPSFLTVAPRGSLVFSSFTTYIKDVLNSSIVPVCFNTASLSVIHCRKLQHLIANMQRLNC